MVPAIRGEMLDLGQGPFQTTASGFLHQRTRRNITRYAFSWFTWTLPAVQWRWVFCFLALVLPPPLFFEARREDVYSLLPIISVCKYKSGLDTRVSNSHRISSITGLGIILENGLLCPLKFWFARELPMLKATQSSLEGIMLLATVGQ